MQEGSRSRSRSRSPRTWEKPRAGPRQHPIRPEPVRAYIWDGYSWARRLEPYQHPVTENYVKYLQALEEDLNGPEIIEAIHEHELWLTRRPKAEYDALSRGLERLAREREEEYKEQPPPAWETSGPEFRGDVAGDGAHQEDGGGDDDDWRRREEKRANETLTGSQVAAQGGEGQEGTEQNALEEAAASATMPESVAIHLSPSSEGRRQNLFLGLDGRVLGITGPAMGLGRLPSQEVGDADFLLDFIGWLQMSLRSELGCEGSQFGWLDVGWLDLQSSGLNEELLALLCSSLLAARLRVHRFMFRLNQVGEAGVRSLAEYLSEAGVLNDAGFILRGELAWNVAEEALLAHPSDPTLTGTPIPAQQVASLGSNTL
jgi:hypothetical protein